jgi:MFS family permease
MRGRALAFLVLIATLIGMGLGPPIVGGISDLLKAQLGPSEALRWSLLIMTIPNVLGILCFLRCARTLQADVARARAMDGLEPPR